jgi:ribosome biogenesis GTPase A
MAKAKRQIAEVMPKIDVVIEVLDARLPWTKTLYQSPEQE